MFARLAFRNVRRQIGNDLIYFVTVMLSVALLFSINNMIHSPQIEKISQFNDVIILMNFVQVVSMLVTAFVLAYATGFMLRLRAREFGLYLTVGMTRRNVIFLFLTENLLLAVLALAVGLICGIFLYQGAMALLCSLMEIQVSFAGYSLEGLIMTVIASGVMFMLAALSASIYLGRVNLKDLLSGTSREPKNSRGLLWSFLALLFFAGIILTAWWEYQSLESSVTGDEKVAFSVVRFLIVLMVLFFFFHFCLAKGLFVALLRSRKLCAGGTRQFLFRQLTEKMNMSAVMIGLLSVLIGSAVVFANVSMTEKSSSRMRLDQDFPFDILYAENRDPSSQAIPLAEAEKKIESYMPIREKTEFFMFGTGDNLLGQGIPECQYEGYDDKIVKVSDFNVLLQKLGIPAVTLNQEYLIIDEYHFLTEEDFGETVLTVNGQDMRCAGVRTHYPRFCNTPFYAVVPDEAIDSAWIPYRQIAYELEEPSYDAFALNEELLYPMDDEEEKGTQFSLRECNRIYNNSMAGVLAVSMTFISVIFVCMSLAMLSLKTLSSLQADRERYRILSRLGADRELCRKTLHRQVFAFFALPFVLPGLSIVPTAWTCYQIMAFQGMPQLKNQVFTTALWGAGLLFAVYLMYYMMTCYSAERNTFHYHSH